VFVVNVVAQRVHGFRVTRLVGLHPVLRCVVYALGFPPVPKNASMICPVFGPADRKSWVTKFKLFRVVLPTANSVVCGDWKVIVLLAATVAVVNVCQLFPSLE